jgi:DNA-directed RNA polymerase III subunit RPC1
MQPPEGAQVDLGKAQVIDSVPKVIKELKFKAMRSARRTSAARNKISSSKKN